jgi:AcrR family transcriptional regulator
VTGGGRGGGKLPRGRHGLSRGAVVSDQRERMLRAVVDAVAANGYNETAVADILERSGVSRRTFYDQFKDKQDCFLHAYEATLSQVMSRVTEAYGRSAPWPDRIRAGLEALLEFLARDPPVARIALVEVLAAGPKALERYEQAMRGFERFFEAGREESGDELPDNISEAIVGGVAQVLYLRVLKGDAKQLLDGLDELVYFALVPFVGHERASGVAFPAGSERRAG